ncbi:MAG: hypothetical protein GF329_01025 [Candidatus Lokiarchaeota archaeon]|nr:hypothetical protein [Candidatus Lokiarchaeota archaeon]
MSDWIFITSLNETHYLDTGLDNLQSYWYKISAVDEVPNEGTNSTAVEGIPEDTIAPEAVSGLSVIIVPTGNTLNISWNLVSASDMDVYMIYRDTKSGFTPNITNFITNVTHPSSFYLDKGLVDGVYYYYKVLSVDDDNNYLPPITQKGGKPSDTVPPKQPEVVNVTNINGSIFINWTMAEEDDFVKYEIWRNGSFILVQTIYNKSINYWTDDSDNLLDNVIYYYEIRVFDEVGYNETAAPKYSPEVQPSGDNKPPANITSLTGNSIFGGHVRLQWTAPDTSDIIYYKIYRSQVSGFTPNSSNLIGNTTGLIYDDIDPKLNGTGVQYYYQVRAVDENNNTATGGVETMVAVVDTVRPTSVNSFKALNQFDGSIKLVWTASTPLDFYRYTIYRYKGYNPQFNPTAANIIISIYDNKTLEYIDDQSNLIDGSYYSYKIAVADEVGDSTYLFESNFTTNDIISPINVTGLNVLNEGTGDILNISWDINPELDVQYYNIYRSENPGFVPSPSNFIATSETNFYKDESLIENNTYYYRVSAIDEEDNEGFPSDEKSGIPYDTKPPGSPVITSQIYETRSIIILIEEPTEDPDVLYYNIYRSNASSSGPWDPIANISKTGSTTVYVDSDLPVGTYWYYVNAQDEKLYVSINSNIVNGTIKLFPPILEYVLDNDNGDIAIQWKDNESNKIDLIAGYKIYRQNSSGGPKILITNIADRVTKNYLEYGVPNGNWSYYITTIDIYNEESSFSNPINITINDIIAPESVDTLQCISEPGIENVSINWEAPGLERYGADIEYYHIYISTEDIASLNISNLNPNFTNTDRLNTSHIFMNLSDGLYYIAVIVLDENNHSSDLSNIIEVIVDTTPPIEPIVKYPSGEVEAGQRIYINITVYDAGGIDELIISYRIGDGSIINISSAIDPDFDLLYEFSNGTQVWGGSIPGQPAGSSINFSIIAIDVFGYSSKSSTFSLEVASEPFPWMIIIVIAVVAIGAVAAVITITRIQTKEKKKEYVAEELLPLPI